MSDLKTLEVLLQKFKIFVEKTNKKQNELEIILQRFNFYKKQFYQPMRNGHYINCIWSNDVRFNHVTHMDFCSCYHIQKFPRVMCSDIVETIGLGYILNF